MTAIQTGGLENSLSVRTGATVQDLLDSLRSTLGGTQSLAVYADRDSAQAGSVSPGGWHCTRQRQLSAGGC